ncbi:MAG: transketolase [Alphaproteobacteria bacterium]|nr:transketolase [Alphaproteobacteria bacterium]
MNLAPPPTAPLAPALRGDDRRRILGALERKVLWLACWMIHHANHVRPKRDGLKVGGHQASCSSVATLMTALYFDVLRREDRVAVKPHASPIFHAIQYLLGNQSVEQLQRFRAFGGAQSYPSRTKDGDDVDISTGSVGLGVGFTTFASLAQDYLRLKRLLPGDRPPGRMVAIAGDAELDEGNVFEALLEGWKHDVRNLWWVIDYNRQSLDSVVADRLFLRLDRLFEMMGWRVVTLKYGRRLEAAFTKPGGEALRSWIDACPNSLYSALTFKGGAAWREHLRRDLGDTAGIKGLLDEHDDAALGDLMTNLAGHDLDSVLSAFHGAGGDDTPVCFIAYTIKGFGLPFAGHKDNHAGLMTPEQMAAFQRTMGVAPGAEWDRFAGLDVRAEDLTAFLGDGAFAPGPARNHKAPRIVVPHELPVPAGERMATQEAFGRVLNAIARDNDELAARIVTASPDVTVSTNLGPWVNRRAIFDQRRRDDVFSAEKVVSAQKWVMTPEGQHLELGIAENNLFLLLAALGLSGPLFGTRLLPIGTLYDPFIERGLDALNYACYMGARFILVATPSGVTLAPEGGAHQSIKTPLIGLAQDGLTSYEPAFVDELVAILGWAFEHIQADDGGAVYLRLSTRPLDQPKRTLDPAATLAGGQWLVPPAPGAELAIVAMGAVLPEAIAAHRLIVEDVPGAGLLGVTSADRLYRDWRASLAGGSGCHIARLLAPMAANGGLVTVTDGHPATLTWLGSVARHRVHPLGVDHFGQSGDIPDLYRAHGLDADAIVDAAAELLLRA